MVIIVIFIWHWMNETLNLDNEENPLDLVWFTRVAASDRKVS